MSQNTYFFISVFKDFQSVWQITFDLASNNNVWWPLNQGSLTVTILCKHIGTTPGNILNSNSGIICAGFRNNLTKFLIHIKKLTTVYAFNYIFRPPWTHSASVIRIHLNTYVHPRIVFRGASIWLHCKPFHFKIHAYTSCCKWHCTGWEFHNIWQRQCILYNE